MEIELSGPELGGGDHSFASAEIADFLCRLRELGVNEHAVELERDIGMVMQSVSPKDVAIWIAERIARWVANRPSASDGREKASPATIVDLVTRSFSATSPALDRLKELIEHDKAGG